MQKIVQLCFVITLFFTHNAFGVTDNKKRILIFCENLETIGGEMSKTIGGVEKVFAQVTDMLQQRGYVVGYMDIPLDSFNVPFTADLQSQYPWGITSKIAEKIKAFEPDYIIMAAHGVMTYLAGKYCFAHEIPFTVFYPARMPEIMASNFYIPKCLGSYIVNNYLALATTVLVPTPSMKEELQQIDIKDVVSWPHGIDLNVFSYPTTQEKQEAIVACNLQNRQRPFYLYVARLSKEKNIEAFLDVKVPGTKILVGPEDMGYSIPELQKQHPDIIITGPKRGKDLINYYHSADIFLFTSKNDSFGLVLLEALASGLPIVGFNTYGPRDVVPKGTGVSYLADKDEELQTCAVKAWEDLQNGLITHQQCRDYAAQFSWDVAVDKLLLSLTQIMVLPDDEDESCCVCKC